MRRRGLHAFLWAFLLAMPSLVMASWSSGVEGPASAVAATVNSGSTPAATVSGRTVALSWSPSTLSNGIQVTGYVIKRYDSGDVEQTIVSGSCASPGAATSCSETAVPPGTWMYSVTPVYGNWLGAESAKTSVAVDDPLLTLSPELTRTPATLTGSIANFIDDESIEFRLDGPSGTTLSGTVDGTATPTTVPAGGAASVTVALPGPTPDGAHTIYAVASPSGESATALVTVDNTPPPTPTITSSPPDPANSTTASFSFTDSEAGVTFECRLDGSSFGACSSPHAYSGLVDGSHTFEVRAVDGAGNQSAAAGYTWTVDATAPAVAITFPVADSFYNDSGFNSGCGTSSAGDFCGTASDSGTGVTQVQVSIQRGTGSYWNGSGFSSATEVWFTATGTTSWSYGFAASNFPADDAYTVRARATDGAGNTTTAATTFTIDRTAPTAFDVQSANTSGGTTRKAELGDTFTFTYSEQMGTGSILAGWDGSATNVVVRINHGVTLLLLDGPDILQVWNAGNSAQLPLGEVDLGRTDYVSSNVTFGATGTPATMVQSGSDIVITLGTPSNSGAVTRAAGSGTMRWTPSSTARDRAGNACSTTAVDESGAADGEF